MPKKRRTAVSQRSEPVVFDPIAVALQNIAAPKKCDEDHLRRLGRDLARAMGATQLESAFGESPLVRCMFRALVQLENARRDLFLRVFFTKCLQAHGEYVGAFFPGRLRFLPFRPPAHLTMHDEEERAQVRERQHGEIREVMAKAERAIGRMLAPRGHAGARIWPGGVKIVTEWEDALRVARDAEWEVLNRISGPALRAFYKKYPYVWEMIKVLAGHMVDAAVDEWGDQLQVASEQARIVWRAAAKMQRDLETLVQCAAGALAAGRLRVDGDRPNPFLPFVWVFDLGGWPIGQIGEVSWVFVPPLPIVAT